MKKLSLTKPMQFDNLPGWRLVAYMGRNPYGELIFACVVEKRFVFVATDDYGEGRDSIGNIKIINTPETKTVWVAWNDKDNIEVVDERRAFDKAGKWVTLTNGKFEFDAKERP